MTWDLINMQILVHRSWQGWGQQSAFLESSQVWQLLLVQGPAFEHKRRGALSPVLEYCHKVLIGLPITLSNPFPTLQSVWSFPMQIWTSYSTFPASHALRSCPCLPFRLQAPLLSQVHVPADELGSIPASTLWFLLLSFLTSSSHLTSTVFLWFPASPLPHLLRLSKSSSLPFLWDFLTPWTSITVIYQPIFFPLKFLSLDYILVFNVMHLHHIVSHIDNV